MVRDLVDMIRNQIPVLELATKMTKVKAFEALGFQLKDHLLAESILCMNGTLRAVYDQQKEITRLKQRIDGSGNRLSSTVDDNMSGKTLFVDSNY